MPLSPTPAQADVSRRNGALSNGPTTEAGKARSSLNNLRHNLHGPFRLLPGEDEAAHAALTADLRARFTPAGEVEGRWVEEIAFAMWRRRRLQALEAVVLAAAGHGADEPDARPLPSLATLARYRARVERDHRFAEEQLAAYRATRPRLPRDLVGAQAAQLRWLADCMDERAEADHRARGTDEPETAPAAPPATARTLDPELAAAFDRSMGVAAGTAAPTPPAATPNRRERRRRAALARSGLRLAA